MNMPDFKENVKLSFNFMIFNFKKSSGVAIKRNFLEGKVPG
jgi:hypothetical protein